MEAIIADFFYANGSYLNLDHTTCITVNSETSIVLHRGDGLQVSLEDAEARAILAHIRGESTASSHSQAAQKAQELADSLSKGQKSTEHRFTDARGNPHAANTRHEGDGWVAESGNLSGRGRSEIHALQALAVEIEAANEGAG